MPYWRETTDAGWIAHRIDPRGARVRRASGLPRPGDGVTGMIFGGFGKFDTARQSICDLPHVPASGYKSLAGTSDGQRLLTRVVSPRPDGARNHGRAPRPRTPEALEEPGTRPRCERCVCLEEADQVEPFGWGFSVLTK